MNTAPLHPVLSWIPLIVLGLGLFLPITLSWTPVFLLLALCGVFLIQKRPLPNIDFPAMLWGVLLVLLGAASAAWSINPGESLERAVKVGLIIIPGIFLIPFFKRLSFESVFRFFPYIFAAALMVVNIEFWCRFPIMSRLTGEYVKEYMDMILMGSALNKNIAVMLLLLPFSLFYCVYSRKWALGTLIALLALGALMRTESQAGVIAACVMALVAIGSFFPAKILIRGTAFAFSFLVVLFVWIAPVLYDLLADEANKVSLLNKGAASMRLEIWDFIARKIMTNPLLGFGMDSTRYVTDFETTRTYFNHSTVMHPHNVSLQLWMDFGIAGIIWGLGFFWMIVERIIALPRANRRLPLIALAGVLTFLMLSWSLWAGWLIGLCVIVAGLAKLWVAETSSDPATS